MNTLSDAISKWSFARTMNYLIGTSTPNVSAAELKCVEQQFNDHIHHGEVASHGSIVVLPLEFKLSAFMRRLNSLGQHDSGGVHHRAVFVHYGLDPKNRLDVALEFVKLRAVQGTPKYTFDRAAEFYSPVGKDLVSIGGGLSTWNAKNGRGEEYTERVVIRESSANTWRRFTDGTDAYATAHAYDHILEKWIQHNTDGYVGDPTIRLIPIATASARIDEFELGFKQGCAWSFVEIPVNDVQPSAGLEFLNKAADLGSPCPPNRPQLSFLTAGLPRKTGC